MVGDAVGDFAVGIGVILAVGLLVDGLIVLTEVGEIVGLINLEG